MPRNVPLFLVRIVVGIVFLTEGVLKFMFPEEFGAGRFAHIGLPLPHLLGPFVGGVEIAAGGAILLNLFSGEAAVLLLCVMITALITTKLPILLGHSIGPFSIPKSVGHPGVIGFLHEARTDLAMLFCLLSILVDSGLRLGRSKPGRNR